MPKRKRNAFEDDGDHVSLMRKNDVSEKLIQSKKLLHRALKTAKGFERQKLGKRLKHAAEAGSNDEVARINREIEALKGLDLDKMTDAQLYKSLLKVKAIAESDLLPDEVRRELPMPEGTEDDRKALHNVTSGMWNMKPVKEVMERVMSGMHIAMGIPALVGRAKRGKKEPLKGILKTAAVGVPTKVETEEDESLGEERGETGSGEPSWEGFGSAESEDLDVDGGVKIAYENNGENENDGMELDEKALSRYDAVIGGSSDEESFDESKYSIKHTSQPSARLSLSLSPEPSDSPSPSEVESQSASPFPEKAAKPSNAKAKGAPKKPSGSTFLPTLMGGYWSGSESSASDFEDDAIAAAPVRKNRPGQMARRAIWEKKFGERANHIKTGKGSVAEKRGKGKNDGWDAKRGAKDNGDRGRERGRGGRQRDFRQATGENTIAVEPRSKVVTKRDDVGKLHPSWEAAKKAKEVKRTATFLGKKVTFD